MSMRTLFRTALVLGLTLLGTICDAQYTYKVQKKNGHLVHIVTIPAQEYTVEFCKAQELVTGRETVTAMAERNDAVIAINSGFFEEDAPDDGVPSGTLIIDNLMFGLRNGRHSCLIKQAENLAIRKIEPTIKARINQKTVPVKTINRHARKNDLVLYTSAWGTRTHTPFKQRCELRFDQDGTYVGMCRHGNSHICKNGFVLSLPLAAFILLLPAEAEEENIEEASLSIKEPEFDTEQPLSAVSGIPLLVENGKVIPDLAKHFSSFYTNAHARTAVGLKKNGDLVIIVAEHTYTKDLKSLTLGEVKTMLKNNASDILLRSLKSPFDLTLEELKKYVEEQYSNKQGAIGYTIPELANLMANLGCTLALNLDGGGSSTLWIDGKVVNHPIDENGMSTERPVSDAILFKSIGCNLVQIKKLGLRLGRRALPYHPPGASSWT